MRSYRKNFFRIFAIFFVMAVPFITVYSLGFDLDLADRQLGNTTSINIETLPRGANISNNGKKIQETPRELRAKDDQTIPLDIALPGYKTEKFLIWAPPKQNTSVRITRLTLLPEKGDKVANFDNVQQTNFISADEILVKRNEKFYIQQFSFTGLQGSEIPVKNIGNVTSVSTNSWDELGDNAYFDADNNVILNKAKDIWSIINLNIFAQKFTAIAKTTDSTFLGLDDQNILWQFNTDLESIVFLDSNVQNLTSTLIPNNIWLEKDNNLIRLNRDVQDAANFILTDKVYSKFPVETYFFESSLPKSKQFTISSIYQGLLVQKQTNLYYIPDYKPEDWVKLASNAQNYLTTGNSLFWIDDNKTLQSYNLYLKEWEKISTLSFEDKPESLIIKYYSSWNRILIYSSNKVQVIWFDKEIYNKNILGYYPVEWINNANCSTNIVDRYQYCLNNNNLETYKNLSFW